MHNARFRLMVGLAGATLCLFAVTTYGQQTSPTTGTPAATDANASPQGTTGQPTTTDQAAPTTTTTGTATDATTTTTTTRTFPGGLWGIIAVVVLVVIVLAALFRGRDRTVVRETYASSSAASPGPRTTSSGTTADDRMNVNSRAASGTGTNSGGMNDPNARR
jgi:hypothetical protein